MGYETWNQVDQLIDGQFVGSDPALQSALANNAKHGLPAIDVSASQGKFLNLIARMIGAKRILEFGTLGGFSTFWFARAIPDDGEIISFELEPEFAVVARENIANAGEAAKVEVRVGPASESLGQLEAESPEPFDLVFIDADKVNGPEYFRRSLALCKVGSVVILDNVVREGAILDPADDDESSLGSLAAMALIANEPRVSATALQTVGNKGHDGFAIALVIA